MDHMGSEAAGVNIRPLLRWPSVKNSPTVVAELIKHGVLKRDTAEI